MSEDDEERVEYRLSTTGRLVNATKERIEDLLRLRADREKLSRPPPTVSFGAVMAGKRAPAAPVEAPVAAATPKTKTFKGPPPKAPPRSGPSRKTIIKG